MVLRVCRKCLFVCGRSCHSVQPEVQQGVPRAAEGDPQNCPVCQNPMCLCLKLPDSCVCQIRRQMFVREAPPGLHSGPRYARGAACVSLHQRWLELNTCTCVCLPMSALGATCTCWNGATYVFSQIWNEVWPLCNGQIHLYPGRAKQY